MQTAEVLAAHVIEEYAQTDPSPSTILSFNDNLS
jgi:hypothetical protein